MKPQPLGTVWTATVKLQYIDMDTTKWVTLATCPDTPRHIYEAVDRIKEEMCNKRVPVFGLEKKTERFSVRKHLWVNSQLDGREMWQDYTKRVKRPSGGDSDTGSVVTDEVARLYQ
jgi:hypothetical protein